MKSLIKTICSLQWFRKPVYDYVVAVTLKQRSWGKGCPGPVLRVVPGHCLACWWGAWLPPALALALSLPRNGLWGWLIPGLSLKSSSPRSQHPCESLLDLLRQGDSRQCKGAQRLVSRRREQGVSGGYGGQLQPIPTDWALTQGQSTAQEWLDLTTLLFKPEQVKLFWPRYFLQVELWLLLEIEL